jgi:hypothetical protein
LLPSIEMRNIYSIRKGRGIIRVQQTRTFGISAKRKKKAKIDQPLEQKI